MNLADFTTLTLTLRLIIANEPRSAELAGYLPSRTKRGPLSPNTIKPLWTSHHAIISNQNKVAINKSTNSPVQTINTRNCRDKRSMFGGEYLTIIAWARYTCLPHCSCSYNCVWSGAYYNRLLVWYSVRVKRSCPTGGISSIKQRSQHHTQSKLTVVFATHHHSNRLTKTTHVLLEMNASEIPPSLVNMYRGLKDKKVDLKIRWQIDRYAWSYSNVAKNAFGKSTR